MSEKIYITNSKGELEDTTNLEEALKEKDLKNERNRKLDSRRIKGKNRPSVGDEDSLERLGGAEAS